MQFGTAAPNHRTWRPTDQLTGVSRQGPVARHCGAVLFDRMVRRVFFRLEWNMLQFLHQNGLARPRYDPCS